MQRVVFSGKTIMAPMVRVGTLPMRLLALDYGADLVYSEEIIAVKLAGSTRIVSRAKSGLTTWIDARGAPVFSTVPQERHAVIAQIGAADPEIAAAAVKMLGPHVAGFDLNCGCPIHFSVAGGMGSALLSKPDHLVAILKAMREAAPPDTSVTAKIRLLETDEATVELVKKIANSGFVDAVAIHCRMVPERPRHPGHWDRLGTVVAGAKMGPGAVKVPLLGNGDVWVHEDIERMKKETGVDGVMIARAVQWNPSILRPGPLDDKNEVIRRYLRTGFGVDGHHGNMKYVAIQILERKVHKSEEGLALVKAKTVQDLAAIWGLEKELAESRAVLSEDPETVIWSAPEPEPAAASKGGPEGPESNTEGTSGGPGTSGKRAQPEQGDNGDKRQKTGS